MTRIETIAIVHQHPRVLLAMKKRGFGAGKYNGLGGGQDDNESLEETAYREAFEEGGIKIKDYMLVGKIRYSFGSDEQDHLVHFFRVSEFDGEPVETEEMVPEWFHVDSIPYERMWKNDSLWFPYFLDGKMFSGYIRMSKNGETLEYELNEVSEL